ncbi:hypothetical protein HZH68_014445 [Vespula germanica]|uniref:Uncharacterized protein n=1 Tax=Vespula germanica TaxID=30212 RepID=A0A834MUQ5_VESGE|nr:hypothetical protein HZH68_014445 [Vespula germanica]
MLSPPRRTPKLYIPQPDGPRSRSTYNIDLLKWRSGDAFSTTDDDKCSSQPVGPQVQQPPSGGTWVGSTCDILKSMSILYLKSKTKLSKWRSGSTFPSRVDKKGIYRTTDGPWFISTYNFDEHASPIPQSKWRSGSTFPSRVDKKGIYRTTDGPWFISTYNFDEYASPIPQHAVSASSTEDLYRNGEVGEHSPPETTRKLYIGPTDSPWFISTFNFDKRASPIPQHAVSASSTEDFFKSKWRSGSTFPSRVDKKGIYRTTDGPWFISTYNFDEYASPIPQHAVSASSTEDFYRNGEVGAFAPPMLTRKAYIGGLTVQRNGEVGMPPQPGRTASYIFDGLTASGSDLLSTSTRTRFPQVVTKRTKWRSGDASPTREECKVIEMPAGQPLVQICLQFQRRMAVHYNVVFIVSGGTLGRSPRVKSSLIAPTITNSDLQLAVRVIGLVWFRTSSSGHRNFRREPYVRVFTKISRKSPLCTFGDFGEQSGLVDLEISAGRHPWESPLCTFGNFGEQSGLVDLEIFTPVRDFENLSRRVDLEIFAGCHGSEIKLRSGDTLPPMTTTKSDLRPTLTVTDSVLLSISTSTHRSCRSTHRSSCSKHSPQVIEKRFKLEVGILGLVRLQQSWTFDRLLQLLIQLCFGLR